MNRFGVQRSSDVNLAQSAGEHGGGLPHGLSAQIASGELS